MDFTIEKYNELLEALKQHKSHRIRHDVDAKPLNSLRVAQEEARKGMKGTYYFRSMHFAPHRETIQAIAALGHEIGYHYECLTTCNGDMAAAYKDFCRNLKLRSVVPIAKACAHGSPRSPHNSMDIWQHQDYHTFGIEHESMLDTDFSSTLYLTDTGRRWDGYRVAVRDKVPQYQEDWNRAGLAFHSTDDIIHAISNIQHPIHQKALLINTHPQRWMPFGAQWLKEIVLQNSKNIVKRIIVSTR